MNTGPIADGAYTGTLRVTDRAGNTASSAISVTIDNTQPTASISEPTANARLRGLATIRWSASDTNLDRVWLSIDGEARDLTGSASFVWDTNTVGDGSHTIAVQVLDKAGNEYTVSVTVTTENVAAATSAANTAGLVLGLLIAVAAAAVGFVIGYRFGLRRKPARVKTPEDVLKDLEKEL